MKLRFLAAAFAAMLLGGCLPLPIAHTDTVVPYTSGTVEQEGKPLPRVLVWQTPETDEGVCESGPGSPPLSADTTGADGRFALPKRIKRDRWLIIPLVPFDPAASWRVCFRPSGRGAGSWLGTAFGATQPPDSTRLNCTAGAGGFVTCEPSEPLPSAIVEPEQDE